MLYLWREKSTVYKNTTHRLCDLKFTLWYTHTITVHITNSIVTGAQTFCFFHSVEIVFCCVWVSSKAMAAMGKACSSAMSVSKATWQSAPPVVTIRDTKSWQPDWEQHQHHWKLIDRAACGMWMLLQKLNLSLNTPLMYNHHTLWPII